jgi:hypothetical protein
LAEGQTFLALLVCHAYQASGSILRGESSEPALGLLAGLGQVVRPQSRVVIQAAATLPVDVADDQTAGRSDAPGFRDPDGASSLRNGALPSVDRERVGWWRPGETGLAR